MLRICILVIATLFSVHGIAQLAPAKVDQQVKHPATKERAAKADRHVTKDRNIYDTSAISARGKKGKGARKRGSCN